MNSKEFLARELKATGKTIEWAISVVPKDRLLTTPPHSEHPNSGQGFKNFFGEWSAYRHLFHVVYYERNYALPTMKHWLGGPPPGVDLIFPDMKEDEIKWKREIEKGPELEALLNAFRTLREEQIEVTRSIPLEVWREERVSTGLGKVSAELVVTKTIEHTLVHGKSILRNALYWERALEWLDNID